MPTKVWPLHPLCKLGEVAAGSFLVRGKNSNILLALASHHVKKRALVRPCAFQHLAYGRPCQGAGALRCWRRGALAYSLVQLGSTAVTLQDLSSCKLA